MRLEDLAGFFNHQHLWRDTLEKVTNESESRCFSHGFELTLKREVREAAPAVRMSEIGDLHFLKYSIPVVVHAIRSDLLRIRRLIYGEEVGSEFAESVV